MKLRSRAEEKAISRGGGEGGHRQEFQRLWVPPGDGDLLQIPWRGDIGGRQGMAGGGEELFPGKVGLEEDDTHPKQVGGGAAGVRIIFQGRGTCSAALWIGDLGAPTPHGQGPGGVSGPGGDTYDGAAPAKDTRREVDIHLGGNGTGGGRVLDDEGIHKAAPEHGHAVHRYGITIRPV